MPTFYTDSGSFNDISATGSVLISGSLTVSGTIKFPTIEINTRPNILSIDTASGQLYYVATSSINAATASFVTASNVWGPFGSNSIQSASYASGSTSASYAQTASFALNVSSPFPFTGSAIITGSLVITGSTISTLGFTGSLFGTASYVSGSVFGATNPASSASYASTASHVENGRTNYMTLWQSNTRLTSSTALYETGSTIAILRDGVTTDVLNKGSLILYGSASGENILRFQQDDGRDYTNNWGKIIFSRDFPTTSFASIESSGYGDNDNSGSDYFNLIFRTAFGAGGKERVRITNKGLVGINRSGSAVNAQLHVSESENTSLALLVEGDTIVTGSVRISGEGNLITSLLAVRDEVSQPVASFGKTNAGEGRFNIRTNLSSRNDISLELSSSNGLAFFARPSGARASEPGQVSINYGIPLSANDAGFIVSGSIAFHGLPTSTNSTTFLALSGTEESTRVVLFPTNSFTAATSSFVTASNVWGPFGTSSVQSASYASGSTSASYSQTSSQVENGREKYMALWQTGTRLTSSTLLYETNNRIGVGSTSPQFDIHLNPSYSIFFAGNNADTANSTGLLIGEQHTSQSLSASRAYAIIGVAAENAIAGTVNGDIVLSPRTSTSNTGIRFIYTGSSINTGSVIGQSFTSASSFISGTFALPTIASTNQPHFLAYNSSSGLVTYASTSSINAATASFVTASNVWGPFGANSIQSASYASGSTSASYAATASNVLGGQDKYIALWTGSTQLTRSIIFQTGSFIGINTTNPTFALDVVGSAEITNGLNITGSLISSGSTQTLIGTTTIRGNTTITGSNIFSGSTQTLIGATTIISSGSTVLNVSGSSGSLFQVNDLNSGSLFSVNNAIGLPIVEVFSGGITKIGNYPYGAIYTSIRIIATGSTNTVYSLSTSSWDAAFFDYVAMSGSNMRAGQIISSWSGSVSSSTEITNNSIGTTTAITFQPRVIGSNMVLNVSCSGLWTVKTIVRGI